MALAITTVTNSIAALSVTGLTIKDVDEILYAPTDRECPLLQHSAQWEAAILT